MSFTPGPWVGRKFPTGNRAIEEIWVMDSIPDQDGKVVANAICKMIGSNPNVEPNSRLVISAPKLFELLESAAIVLRQHGIDTTEIDAVLAEVKGDKS